MVAGDDFSCGITSEGFAYCWGNDTSGRLGNGDHNIENSLIPSAVDTSSVNGSKTFLQLEAGRFHVCGITTDKHVYCWGYDHDGQLGNATPCVDEQKPQPINIANIKGEKTFDMISAGAFHTCGLTTDQVVYCWGNDSKGQLGDNFGIDHQASPVEINSENIVGVKNFIFITCGYDHSCGLTVDHRVYCWGTDIWGSLGNGGNPDFSVNPVAVFVSHLQGD